MQTKQAAPAGPLMHATLIVGDAALPLQAYTALGFTAHDDGVVTAAAATAWGQPGLAGRPVTWLSAAGAAAPLLRLITVPGTPPRPTRFSHGWMALEILVRDVDALAPRVAAAGFEIVGAPADLDLSPAIRAMQAIGPAGEMLYLTQVKAAVPPFEIPLSAGLPAGVDIGPLFIAVLSTPSREAVVDACAPLQPKAALRFETRITVLNQAHGRAVDQRWPVATLQFAGGCLFEIDETAAAPADPGLPGGSLPAGLAWVTMQAPLRSAGLQRLGPGCWLELGAAGGD